MTNLTKKTLIAAALIGSAQLAFAEGAATTVRTIVQSEEAVTTALKLINENPAKAWSVISGNAALSAAATSAGISSSKDLLIKITRKNESALNFVRQNAPALIGSKESAQVADAAVANSGSMLETGGAAKQANVFQVVRTAGKLGIDPVLLKNAKDENVIKQFGKDFENCLDNGSFTEGSKASEVVAVGARTALENRANTALQLNEQVVSSIDKAQEEILGQKDAQDRASRADDALFGKNEGCHLFNKLSNN